MSTHETEFQKMKKCFKSSSFGTCDSSTFWCIYQSMWTTGLLYESKVFCVLHFPQLTSMPVTSENALKYLPNCAPVRLYEWSIVYLRSLLIENHIIIREKRNTQDIVSNDGRSNIQCAPVRFYGLSATKSLMEGKLTIPLRRRYCKDVVYEIRKMGETYHLVSVLQQGFYHG